MKLLCAHSDHLTALLCDLSLSDRFRRKTFPTSKADKVVSMEVSWSTKGEAAVRIAGLVDEVAGVPLALLLEHGEWLRCLFATVLLYTDTNGHHWSESSLEALLESVDDLQERLNKRRYDERLHQLAQWLRAVVAKMTA